MPVPTDAAITTPVAGMNMTLIGASDQSNALAPVRTAAFSGDNVAYQTLQGLLAASMGLVFNETNFDRVRGNTAVTAVTLAARTSGSNLPQVNYNARGVQVVLTITAASGTGGVSVVIEGQDPVNAATFYPILTSANFTTTGTTVLRVYPGLVAAANLTANDVIPRVWRMRVVYGDGTSYTYSLGLSYIV